jgi:hypothetical protein
MEDKPERTQVHDVITADGAVIDDDIPGPESNSVPLYGRCNQLSTVFDLRKSEKSAGKAMLTFLTSKRFFPSEPSPAAFFEDFTALSFAELASCISTSAILEDIDRM